MTDTQIPQPSGSSSSSTSYPATHVKRYRPYFSPEEIERLSAKQRGKLSVEREERMRQQACGFIDAVGVRCGFPRRTIATAQMLYMRFHLFFPYKDFNYIEVSLSTLYVASKLHDTLKKARDIILASYAIRLPHLLHKKGNLDPAAIDAAALEGERARVLGIERLVLESVCFRFGMGGGGLEWVVKIAKKLGLQRDQTNQVWRTTIDCYRTPAPLSYAPHAIALGSIYVCALLLLGAARSTPFEESHPGDHVWSGMVKHLETDGLWQEEFCASVFEVNVIAQALIDLHITIISTPTSDPQHALTPSPSSPRETPMANPASATTSSLNHGRSSTIADTAFRLSPYWTVQTLTELKVYLRERAAAANLPYDPLDGGGTRTAPARGEGGVGYDVHVHVHDGSTLNGANELSAMERPVVDASEGLGQNDGTTRFIWDQGVSA